MVRDRESLLSLADCSVLMWTCFHLFNVPVPETVPEVPSANPIFLADIGHVTTLVVIRSSLVSGTGDKCKNLSVFGCLGNLVPFIRRCHGGVGPRLLRQVPWVVAQLVSRKLSVLLPVHATSVILLRILARLLQEATCGYVRSVLV